MHAPAPSTPPPAAVSRQVLAWYDRHARTLPWRLPPDAEAAGERADPYRVWLSEIMLQQTTVRAVAPYYADFLERWPTLADLAAAETDAVMRAWAGLGYYSRARNLIKCARILVEEHGGRFPDSARALRQLPGIGPYTAAAIAAIAFDEPVAVIDGNIERVIARLHAVDQPLPDGKTAIRRHAERLTPAQRPGDYAQAMMDLGATICTPRTPACALCPVSGHCRAASTGRPTDYPRKTVRPERPVRYGAAFVLMREDGAVLLRKRADKGLLGGMAEVPTGPWAEDQAMLEDRRAAPVATGWQRLPQLVTHTFTHFHLRLAVYRTTAGIDAPEGAWWSAQGAHEALPTVMRKVLATARGADGSEIRPAPR